MRLNLLASSISAPLLALALTGCGATWKPVDGDGDGLTPAQGDCNEGADGAGVFPGAPETWYDGIDQDCDGRDDFDKDGDGHVAAAHGGDDCWDDDDDADAPVLVTGGGFTVLRAADVFPGAVDTWYDGVDQDCGGDDDFDQDGDGFRSSVMPDQDGSLGDDCWDDVDDARPDVLTCSADGSADQLTPGDVFPGAADAPLDGVDAGCDGDDGAVEFDADGDTFAWCEECDDSDAAIFPDDSVPEVWYNGVDENCDGNDADQDGDGFAVTGYSFPLPDRNGDGTPDLATGDCWDDPTSVPSGYDAINGFDQPAASAVYPTATETWYDGVDGDCSGGGDFDQDGDGQTTATLRDRDRNFGSDCDDANAGVYVGALEVWYDDVDQDCDGNDDDQDGDGFVAAASGGNDCNDENNLVNPGVAEQCDARNVDENCNGTADDGDPTITTATIGATPMYRDLDGDTFGAGVASGYCDAVHPGYSAVNTDCLDSGTHAAVTFPGSAERESATSCRTDVDGDGYGDIGASGSVTAGTDCVDATAAINPGATETAADGTDSNCDAREECYQDADADSYRTTTLSTYTVTAGATGVCSVSGRAASTVATADCRDDVRTTNPGVTDVDADGTDSDCSGTETCYEDADRDDYRTTTLVTYTVTAGATAQCTGSGRAASTMAATDCVDTVAAINPGATETAADGTDSNCDASEQCYQDADGDSYRTATLSTYTVTRGGTTQCTGSGKAPSSMLATDCVDSVAAINPGATETAADGTDSNCDATEQCYQDADADGFRTATLTAYTVTAGSTGVCSTSGRALSSVTATDCVDSNAAINPSATETAADGTDSNCDASEQCFQDADGDSYRTTTLSTYTVTAGGTGVCSTAGRAASSVATTDCVDSNSAINPGATETAADGTDSNCDASEQCFQDADGDSYRTTTLSTYTVTSGGTGQCTGSGKAPSSMPSTDCVDSVAAINPGATETAADGTDSNCDASEQCFQDADGDSYRTTTLTAYTVTAGATGVCSTSGRAASSVATTDCVDSVAAINPGATETPADGTDSNCDASEQCYQDADSDSFRTATLSAYTVTRGGTGQCTGSGKAPASMTATDCADSSAAINPSATETAADGTDSNCDASESCFQDADADGYRTGTLTAYTVTAGGTGVCSTAGRAASSVPTGDCNDANAAISPGDPEVCDGGTVDEDCDGLVNDADTITVSTSGSVGRYTDADLDGRGAGALTYYCSAPGSGVSIYNDDCLDSNAFAFPGAAETESLSSCREDADSDGYGDASPPAGVTAGTDCNDARADVSPGDPEVCDASNVDEDCDGTADNADASATGKTTFYTDADLDGHAGATTVSYCDDPGAGVEATSTDCDDADAYVFPGATELCDGQFNNCSTSGSWSATTSEDGLVTRELSGAWTNVSISTSSSTVSSVTLGDGTYHVCEGAYYANLSITADKDPVIAARNGSVASGAGPEDFVISGGASLSPTLTVDAGPGRTGTSATVTGVTIRGSARGNTSSPASVCADYGAGIFVTASTSATHLTMTDAIVDEGVASCGGGLALRSRGGASLTDTVVQNNQALHRGGGVYADGFATLACTRCDFTGNDVVVTSPSTVADGGAFAFETSSTVTSTFTDGTFSGNTAGRYGGVGWVFNGARVTVDGSVVSGNSAVSGGAFTTLNGSALLTLIDVEVASNTASADGGALWIGASSTVSCTGPDTSAFDAGFRNNSAVRGGAVWVNDAATAALNHTTCDYTGNNATSSATDAGDDFAAWNGTSIVDYDNALGLDYDRDCSGTPNFCN